ncbi:MAG: hypothetical protein ACOY9Y_14450 [Bacillota bacterium]
MGKHKGRKKKKKLPKHRVQGINTSSLENKVRGSGLFSGKVTFVHGMKEKMSEVLLDFAAPFLDGLDEPKEMEKVISFAAVVWNLSLLPEDQQKNGMKEIADIFGQGGQEYRNVGMFMTEVLLERKKKFFPNNKRLIINYEFGFKNGLPWLNVASTI